MRSRADGAITALADGADGLAWARSFDAGAVIERPRGLVGRAPESVLALAQSGHHVVWTTWNGRDAAMVIDGRTRMVNAGDALAADATA